MFGYRLHKRIFVPSAGTSNPINTIAAGAERTLISEELSLLLAIFGVAFTRAVSISDWILDSALSGSAFWPTTWPNRRKIMAPRTVRVLGVKTPPKVPNLIRVTPDLPSPIIVRSGRAIVAQITVVGKVESCSGRSSHPPVPQKLAVIALIS